MSSPAIRALKETFNSHITLLTSSMSKTIAGYIEEIDEVFVYDLPWVKTDSLPDEKVFFEVIDEIRERRFDAAVIFTVYSQNPLPAAMLAYLAGIPVRLAYCRENPYQLLTHWIADAEPYSFIRHQVRRDLDLVAHLGAKTTNDKLRLKLDESSRDSLREKLRASGVDLQKPFVVLHPGVSEKKREYPKELWLQVAKRLSEDFQILFTGAASEGELTEYLAKETGNSAYSLGGLLNLNEFIALLKESRLVVSVNTGTIHLAAALNAPIVVLYAATNPQHLPWKARGKALIYDVPEELRSKNEIIRFVHELYFSGVPKRIEPDEVVAAVDEVLSGKHLDLFPEMPISGPSVSIL